MALRRASSRSSGSAAVGAGRGSRGRVSSRRGPADGVRAGDAYGLRVIHARAFNHSGPGQEPIYAIAAFAQQIARGLDAGEDPIRIETGNADTRRDYTDVRDIVRAYRLLAAQGTPGEVYNVCSGVTRSARELVAGLAEIAGVAVDHVVDPARVRAHEVMEIRGDASKLEAATGWRPQIPLEQTLADALASFRAA